MVASPSRCTLRSMRSPLLLLAPAAAVVVMSCAAPPPVAPTVTLAGPPAQPVAQGAEPARVAEPTPAPKPAPKATITGRWKEEFIGRGGCSDSVTITGVRDSLRIEGADCNDGASYEFEDVRYDGRNLALVLRVPQTGYVVRYTLSWLPDQTLGGEAEVTGAGNVNTYKVRWTRAE